MGAYQEPCSFEWHDSEHPWMYLKPGELIDWLKERGDNDVVARLIGFHGYCRKMCDIIQNPAMLDRYYLPLLAELGSDFQIMAK